MVDEGGEQLGALSLDRCSFAGQPLFVEVGEQWLRRSLERPVPPLRIVAGGVAAELGEVGVDGTEGDRVGGDDEEFGGDLAVERRT